MIYKLLNRTFVEFLKLVHSIEQYYLYLDWTYRINMIIKKKVIMQTVIIIHFLQLPEDNFKPVKLHANNINIDFLCVTDRYDIPIVYEPGIDKNKEFVLDCLKGYQVMCLRIDKCKYIIAYKMYNIKG